MSITQRWSSPFSTTLFSGGQVGPRHWRGAQENFFVLFFHFLSFCIATAVPIYLQIYPIPYTEFIYLSFSQYLELVRCEPVPAALRGIAAPVGTLGFTLAVVMPSIPEEGHSGAMARSTQKQSFPTATSVYSWCKTRHIQGM